jgi:DNA polymerase-3 subunit beta
MKFTCKRSDLTHAVQMVVNAVSARNTLPILANILFETRENALQLSGTDLEVTIKCQLPAEILESGSVTIPAKRLQEIVRELPETEVSITVNDHYQITLTCQKSMFKLHGLPKDDYPNLTRAIPQGGFEIPQAKMLEMIRKTIFSVSNDETRYVLNGVLFTIENQKLRMVSTDGHRLSLMEAGVDAQVSPIFSNIIPAKALLELNKILDSEGLVKIQYTDNQIIFSTPKVELVSRLIDGQFPNYEQVIPKEASKISSCPAQELLAATRRVALMASDKSNSVKYAFTSGKLVISANTPEIGEAQEEMDVQYPGDNITVAFNARYVMDILKNFGSEECKLEMTTNLNPGVFRPAKEDEKYLCVVMPMRL